MLDTYLSGETVTVKLPFENVNGQAIAPASATYEVQDETWAVIDGPTSIDVSQAPANAYVKVDGALNETDPGQPGYRRVVVQFQDVDGNSYQVSGDYLIRAKQQLLGGTNSFGGYGELMVIAAELPTLRAFHGAMQEDQIAALINAWHNIGHLPVKVKKPDTYTLTSGENPYWMSTRKMNAAGLQALSEDKVAQLRRAQVVEADGLLGGQPIEDRRRADMISDSSGESAHFFRTSKPIRYTVYRATLDELQGMLNWSVSIGRG